MENCIGINKIGGMLRAPSCPFVLHNGNLKASSLLRKESPCATIIKCIGAFSHSEKGVSEWVRVYEAKNNDSMLKAVLQFEKVQQNQNGTVMVQ